MTAKLTITLSPEVLKALRASKSIRVAVGGGSAPITRGSGNGKAPRASNGEAGAYRPGSLPAKLMAWAGGRKRPFGVPDLIKKFRIKRGHASMLIAYVTKGGTVKRVGRGEYAVA